MSRNTRQENKAAKAKRALALLRRIDDLSNAMRRQPWVPLETPERAGWYRYFIVRPDIARSPQGPRLERLLNKHLQNVVRSPRKDFKRRNWKTKLFVSMEQSLKALTKKDYETLLPAEKLMFRFTVIRKKLWRNEILYEERYVFNKDWQFEFRIRPYYFTHRQVIDGELDREYQETWDEFNSNLMWRYMDHKWTNHERFDRTPESIRTAIMDREARNEI
jgi:hypothetical protein